MPSATAAAEPLDEPPGVWAGLCGLAVGPGWRLANSVVTVLPSRMPPAARGRLAGPGGGGGGEAGGAAGRGGRAVAGRHVGGVEDVLDAERHALEHPAPALLI